MLGGWCVLNSAPELTLKHSPQRVLSREKELCTLGPPVEALAGPALLHPRPNQSSPFISTL